MSSLKYSEDETTIIRKAISKPKTDYDLAVKEMYRVIARSLANNREYPSSDIFSKLRQNLKQTQDKKLDDGLTEGIVCYLAWYDKVARFEENAVRMGANQSIFSHLRIIAWIAGIAAASIAYPLIGGLKAFLVGIAVAVVVTGVWFFRQNR